METTTVKSTAAIEAGRLDAEFWMTHCHNCRAKFVKQGIGTGYATDQASGIRICYACADDQQRAKLLTETVVGAYVLDNGSQITTWTGGHLMTIESEVTHGDWRSAFGPITYYRAVDVHGQRWYGKGSGRGMCITMRKNKAR